MADTGLRSDFDFYETPRFMTRALVRLHPQIAGTRVLECASGNNAIASVLRDEFGCEVFTNDLDPRHPVMTHGDATTDHYWRWNAPMVDWVISNLPFDVALPCVQFAVKHAGHGCAFLLRKTFLEPTHDRGPWLSAHPPTRALGMPRYSFRGDGSDSVSCDWLLWGSNRAGLPPIVIDYGADKR